MRSLRILVLVLLFKAAFISQIYSEELEAYFYTLSNGMQLVLKPSRQSPVISSLVCVKAGSRYENEFNNGVSHLLEHLLFDGTRSRTRQDITEGIKNKGGYINAFTREDLTGYIVLLPKEHIDFGLEIQADMLFNSIFPDEELPKERKIVIEEIKKDEDNFDYQAEKFFNREVFKYTPYARPVIGFENIISTLSREEIIKYYQARYKPNQMIAFVMGDFSVEEMRLKFARIFETYPAGKIESGEKYQMNFPNRPEIKYWQLPTENKSLSIAFPSPLYTDKDYFAFYILSEILNSGEASPLAKKLTSEKNPLVNNFSVSLQTYADLSVLKFSCDPVSVDKIQEIIDVVYKALFSLAKETFDPKQIQRVQVATKTNDYYNAEKPHYYAMMKADLLINAGYQFLEDFEENLEKVDSWNLKKVAARFFSKPNYIATVIIPREESKENSSEKIDATYLKKVLRNGLTVIIKSHPDLKVLAINLLAKNRSAMESEKTGITDFLHRMLLKGTKNRNKEQISEALLNIGAQIQTNDNPYIPYDDIYTSRQFSFVRLESINEYVDSALSLFSELIYSPALKEGEIESTKKEVLSLTSREQESTRSLGRDLFYQKLFENTPYSKTILGTKETVSFFSQEDLVHFHRVYFAPSNLILSVCTNLAPEIMLSKIENIFSAVSTLSEPVSIKKFLPQPAKNEALSQKRMEKGQVYIYLGNTFNFPETERAPLEVANSILNSRLQQNLRESQGLAYSVGSAVHFDKNFGWYIISMGTSSQNYSKAKIGILEEIGRLKKDPFTEAELDKAKNSLFGSILMSRLSSINQAFYMAVNDFLGFGYDYDPKLTEKIKNVTITDVKKTVEKYFDEKNYGLAVVGKI